MRTLLLLALVLPVFAGAQINRSAKELARENIEDYVVHKLFKDQPYQSVYYGELKNHFEKNQRVLWTIEHKFEVTETTITNDRKMEVKKPYKFIFFLNNKMEVQRAESYQIQ